MSKLVFSQVKLGEEVKMVYITIDSEPKGFEFSNLLWDQEADYPFADAFEDGWELHTVDVYAEVADTDLEVKESLTLCWLNSRDKDHIVRFVNEYNLVEKVIEKLKILTTTKEERA
jgi:hypothetical protein